MLRSWYVRVEHKELTWPDIDICESKKKKKKPLVTNTVRGTDWPVPNIQGNRKHIALQMGRNDKKQNKTKQKQKQTKKTKTKTKNKKQKQKQKQKNNNNKKKTKQQQQQQQQLSLIIVEFEWACCFASKF